CLGVVGELLHKLELDNIPSLRVYNKVDLVRDNLPSQVKNGVSICAQNPETLKELLGMMEHMVFDTGTEKRAGYAFRH
ncbi:MAG: hypothetical protein D3910_17890, partial [Candidatus Electrothrix sp. ATG2]|nr:hypothetical protein [Candidatus Electrothrix sp. ATG2]